MTPFTGESTDSEADLVENDSSPTASPTGFKSYIATVNRKSGTIASDGVYDVPYDCLPNFKKRETWFGNKRNAGKASTMKGSPKVLKRCAPYTAENMRTVG